MCGGRCRSRVCAGDLLVVNVSVTNRRRRIGSWAVVVEDEVQPEPARAHEKPLRPSVLFPYVPAGQIAQGRVSRAVGPPRAVSPRSAADLHAVSLRTLLPHGRRRPDRDAHGAAPLGAAQPRLGRAAARGLRRHAPPRTAARDRRRFLRTPPVAERRQPPLDPLAEFGPQRRVGRAAVRAAAEPRRGGAGRPLATGAADAAGPRPRRIGRELRRHRLERPVPQRRQHVAPGRQRIRPSSAAPRRWRSCRK